MTDQELERGYAALRAAMRDIEPGRTELFLSMLCLALMARFPVAEQVLALIDQVRAQCDAEAGDQG